MFGRKIFWVLKIEQELTDQRCWARVDELMLRSRWHDDKVAGFDILVFPVYSCFGGAGGEGEGLVDGVHLRDHADVRKASIETSHCSQHWRPRLPTSSPMSPPTGTVISTSCEYSPVQRTLLNSPDSEGRAAVMFGKYPISCFGGPVGILGSFPRRTAEQERSLLLGTEDVNLKAARRRL